MAIVCSFDPRVVYAVSLFLLVSLTYKVSTQFAFGVVNFYLKMIKWPFENNSITISFYALPILYLRPAIRRMGEGNSFSLFTFQGGGTRSSLGRGGGPMSQFFGEGVPGLSFWGGSQVSDFRGESHVSDFQGGSQVSDFWGGVPSLSKGKNF